MSSCITYFIYGTLVYYILSECTSDLSLLLKHSLKTQNVPESVHVYKFGVISLR